MISKWAKYLSEKLEKWSKYFLWGLLLYILFPIVRPYIEPLNTAAEKDRLERIVNSKEFFLDHAPDTTGNTSNIWYNIMLEISIQGFNKNLTEPLALMEEGQNYSIYYQNVLLEVDRESSAIEKELEGKEALITFNRGLDWLIEVLTWIVLLLVIATGVIIRLSSYIDAYNEGYYAKDQPVEITESSKGKEEALD